MGTIAFKNEKQLQTDCLYDILQPLGHKFRPLTKWVTQATLKANIVQKARKYDNILC